MNDIDINVTKYSQYVSLMMLYNIIIRIIIIILLLLLLLLLLLIIAIIKWVKTFKNDRGTIRKLLSLDDKCAHITKHNMELDLQAAPIHQRINRWEQKELAENVQNQWCINNYNYSFCHKWRWNYQSVYGL